MSNTKTREVSFPTSVDSPFDDKFDLPAAIAQVGDLYQAEYPSTFDPRFPLLQMIWDHEDMLRHEREAQQRERIKNADKAPRNRMPGFVKTTTLVLHTEPSQRLFAGRSRSSGKAAIPGLHQLAASFRLLSQSMQRDNPFADLALINACADMEQLLSNIRSQTRNAEKLLEMRRQRGIIHEVVESREPRIISGLTYALPYAFTMCEILVAFDWYCRVVITLQEVGEFDRDRGFGLREKELRDIRSFMQGLANSAAYLQRDPVAALTRADFSAGEENQEAILRVSAAKALFGDMPADVLAGTTQPLHVPRRTGARHEPATAKA